MKQYMITFRSVTYAQRGERSLGKRGISVSLGRTPKWMEQQGCGYGLKLRLSNIQDAALASADMYTVFLDGNHSLVRVKNPGKEGKLLVIRDSYGNCLGGFLAESYGEVVLVDLRYYRRPVSELVREEQFDNILVCYNCLNFLTDTNLPTLK